MKKINSLKVSFIILAIFFAVGCSKETPTPQPPTGGTGGGTNNPMFTSLTANPVTGWYNFSVNLNWTGLNFASATVLGNNGATATVNGNSALTSNLTGPTIFSVTLVNGTDASKTVTQQITVPVWTQRMTIFCKDKGWYMQTNTNIACNASGVPLPGALPVNETIWTDTLSFNPDGTGVKKTQSGQTSNISWSFQQGETKYGESVSDPNPYDIQELTESIWKITRVSEVFGAPGTYSLKTYVYKSSPK